MLNIAGEAQRKNPSVRYDEKKYDFEHVLFFISWLIDWLVWLMYEELESISTHYIARTMMLIKKMVDEQ